LILVLMNFGICLVVIHKVVYLINLGVELEKVKEGSTNSCIEINDDKILVSLSKDINNLGDTINIAIEDRLKSEKMKTELITNVSHDLKTPLTAMINYISLLKKENLKPEHVKDYINVLDKRSQRLKVLIDDLFEASKINSGDIELNLEKTDINQLLTQSIVEMDGLIESSQLDFVINIPKDEVYILADGRKTWRVFENLISNILKYSLKGTRVYIDMIKKENTVEIIMKNISNHPLNFDPNEITERFTRGDLSRNTEGAGLGLSIAKGFIQSQGGKLDINILGDLFIVKLQFELLYSPKT
ncbi:MAG: sensor histidine kinase, partial [Romboutsia sp.]|uniref:sensor histidine kinase n=1 Tax=Romboutsia sp. TaxID=1965302 RepID=UPI003F2C50C0